MKKAIVAIIFGLLLSSTSFAGDLAEELKELNKLYQEGVLTKEEFTEAKSKVIGIDKQSQKKQETKKEPKKEKKVTESIDAKQEDEKILVESSLPACKGTPSKKWSNCHGTYTHSAGEFAGDKYIGEFKKGKFHGQGTYMNVNGDKYIGEFIKGKFYGQGTYFFVDGIKYIGEFIKGKYHGQGTLTHPNGEKYVGEFKKK